MGRLMAEQSIQSLPVQPHGSSVHKVNVEISKKPGERNENILRRFSREVLMAGIAAEWKERRAYQRPMSRRKRRELAVRYAQNRRVRRGY